MLRASWNNTYQGVKDEIEIYDSEFTGDPIVLDAGETPFSFSHQEVTSESNEGILNPYANRIQKGVLDFHFKVGTAQELSLHQDMLDTDSQRFRVVWKQNDSVFWQGYIDTRKREWSERPNYTATIRATDFKSIENIDYPLSDGRTKQIEIIADLLGYLNFDIPIETHTSWIVDGTVSTDDYLNQTYKDKYALREYARTGDESDEPIPVLGALEKVTEGLIVRQVGGVFQLVQIPAFDDPQSVWKFTYNSSGVQQSGAQVDLRQTLQSSIDDGDTVIKAGSGNDGYPAIRRTRVKYDHRTQVSGIQFPERVELSSTNTSESYSQLFLSSNEQVINLRARVEGYWPTPQEGNSPYFQWQIQAGNYYWDEDNSEWTTTVVSNQTDLTPRGRQTSQGYLSLGFLTVSTDVTPQDADGQLEVTFFTADSQDGFADITYYRDITFFIENAIATENSTFIDYQLTQGEGQYRLDLPDSLFGDGPVDYSRGAISKTDSGDYTTDDWARRGETTYLNYHHNLMRDYIDSQRSWTRRINANLWVGFDPTKIGAYKGNNYFYTGGRYANYKWNASLFKINIEAQSDTFEDLPKFTADDATGSSSASSGSSGGGGGLDQSTADSRYFRQANNLSEGDPSTIRGNIGLGTIATFDGDQNLGTTDEVTFDQANVNDAIDPTHALNLRTAESLFITGQRELTFLGLDGITVDPETQDLTEDRTWELSVDINDPIRFENGSIGIKDHGFDQRGVLNTGTQNIYGRKQFQSESQFTEDVFLDKGQVWDDFDSFLSSTTFAGGFAGSGIQIERVNGQWVATVDGLVVRDFARFYELIVEKVRAAGGTLIINDGMRVESVEQTGQTWNWDDTEPVFDSGGTQYSWNNRFKCFIEEDLLVEFTVDDLLKSQTYTGRGVDVTRGTVVDVEGGDPDPEVNTPARFFELYTETGDVEANQEFVRLGNLTDTDRQGGIILTSSDMGAPYTRMYNGLDSWSKEGTMDIIKYQSGRLDNITDPDFPSLDGSQTNLYGVYVDGGFFNNVEVRGNITVLGGNAATGQDVSDGVQESKDYTDSQLAGSVGNETIRSDTAPSQRSGGGDLIEGDTWIKTDEGDLPHTWTGSGWERSYTVIDAGTITLNNVNLNSLDFTPLLSADGTNDIVATINASQEGIEIAGDKIQLTGDTSIDGSFEVTGANISLTGADITLNGDTTVQGSFSVTGTNITLDGDTTVTGDFELQGKVVGDIVMDSGAITNSANDYELTSGGLKMFGKISTLPPQPSASLIFENDDNGDEIARIGSTAVVSGIGVDRFIINANNNPISLSGSRIILGNTPLRGGSDGLRLQFNSPVDNLILTSASNSGSSSNTESGFISVTINGQTRRIKTFVPT